MLSSFYVRRFQHLIVLVLGAGFFIPAHPALSLTNKEAQVFSREYMKGCLQGINQAGLDPTQGEKYCRCTLANLLKLPDEKLKSLAVLTEEQIIQDSAIQIAITSCLANYTQPPQQRR